MIQQLCLKRRGYVCVFLLAVLLIGLSGTVISIGACTYHLSRADGLSGQTKTLRYIKKRTVRRKLKEARENDGSKAENKHINNG